MQTPRTKIADALKAEPPIAQLRVKGWARTMRASKKVVFIELNDGSSFNSLQVVAGEELDNFEEVGRRLS
jgi:asparaginyl-tRNA synthetase